MENKCIKKSTLQQLQILVEYMEANPEFARGSAVFGSSKVSVEEQWTKLSNKLNSHGPPVRTIVEWKKTWTDLKSRTKKKIAENKKNLTETGGGLYRMNSLSELEQIIDRTLFLSKAAAPTGNVFGFMDKSTSKNADSIECCFTPLVDTPPRSSKAVAVVTPSRQEDVEQLPQTSQQPAHLSPPMQRNKREHEGDNIDLTKCSSAKKRKTSTEEQLCLLRRQLRVSEQSAAVAKQHSDATVMLAEATKAISDAVKRIADAAEVQAEAARTNAEIQQQIFLSLEAITMALPEKLNEALLYNK